VLAISLLIIRMSERIAACSLTMTLTAFAELRRRCDHLRVGVRLNYTEEQKPDVVAPVARR
jgi:hypothetical protein